MMLMGGIGARQFGGVAVAVPAIAGGLMGRRSRPSAVSDACEVDDFP